jgi:hypothetical protein
MFSAGLDVEVGPTVEREGFVFTDLALRNVAAITA